MSRHLVPKPPQSLLTRQTERVKAKSHPTPGMVLGETRSHRGGCRCTLTFYRALGKALEGVPVREAVSSHLRAKPRPVYIHLRAKPRSVYVTRSFQRTASETQREEPSNGALRWGARSTGFRSGARQAVDKQCWGGLTASGKKIKPDPRFTRQAPKAPRSQGAQRAAEPDSKAEGFSRRIRNSDSFKQTKKKTPNEIKRRQVCNSESQSKAVFPHTERC